MKFIGIILVLTGMCMIYFGNKISKDIIITKNNEIASLKTELAKKPKETIITKEVIKYKTIYKTSPKPLVKKVNERH